MGQTSIRMDTPVIARDRDYAALAAVSPLEVIVMSRL